MITHAELRWFIARPLSAILAAVMFLIAGCQPAPQPAVPANLDKLDPAVVSLVHDQLANIKARPRGADAHGELGLIYEANAIWSEARQAYDVAARLKPDDYLWRYRLAIATLQVGDTPQATRLLSALAVENPDFAPVHQRLGDLLLQSGNLAGAMQAFRRVVEIQPEATEGYVGLGETLINAGDYAGAVQALEKAVALDDRYGVAHYLLGIAYRSSNRMQEAERELNFPGPGSKRFLPDAHSARLNDYQVNLTAQGKKGIQLMMTGEAAQATAIFEDILANDPRNLTMLNNLAIALMRQNKLQEAQQVLERALAVNDRKFTTYNNLASLALRRQDREQALVFASQAVERAPDRYQTHFLQGRILLGLGRYQEAARSLSRSANLNFGHVDSHVFLAEALLRNKQIAQARAEFLVALELDPRLLRAHAGLVRAGLVDGQLDLAEKHLQILERQAPNNPEVRRYRKELSNARG